MLHNQSLHNLPYYMVKNTMVWIALDRNGIKLHIFLFSTKNKHKTRHSLEAHLTLEVPLRGSFNECQHVFAEKSEKYERIIFLNIGLAGATAKQVTVFIGVTYWLQVFILWHYKKISTITSDHYENTPIQNILKILPQKKWKFSEKKIGHFFICLLKT